MTLAFQGEWNNKDSVSFASFIEALVTAASFLVPCPWTNMVQLHMLKSNTFSPNWLSYAQRFEFKSLLLRVKSFWASKQNLAVMRENKTYLLTFRQVHLKKTKHRSVYVLLIKSAKQHLCMWQSKHENILLSVFNLMDSLFFFLSKLNLFLPHLSNLSMYRRF